MKFRDLPFVASDENGRLISVWSVQPTGSYLADNITGKNYYLQLREVAHRLGNAIFITRVIAAQIKLGNPDCPILIGFLHAMAEDVISS